MSDHEVFKQPYEAFPLTINFGRNLARSEYVVVGSVTALDKDGDSATATILAGSASWGSKTVTRTVQEGDELSSPYKLTFRCETNLGNKWEDEVTLWVKDI